MGIAVNHGGGGAAGAAVQHDLHGAHPEMLIAAATVDAGVQVGVDVSDAGLLAEHVEDHGVDPRLHRPGETGVLQRPGGDGPIGARVMGGGHTHGQQQPVSVDIALDQLLVAVLHLGRGVHVGGFLQKSVEAAVLVQDHLIRSILVRAGDARDFQRQGVVNAHVRAAAGELDRVAGGCFIQLLFSGVALFRQLVVVIAVELDPLARLFLRRILPDERLNIRNGGDLGIGHVDDAVIQQAIHAQMNMRVNKTGQDGFAAGVNHLGVVIPIGGYVRAASNRQNPVAPNGDRLGDLILAVDLHIVV